MTGNSARAQKAPRILGAAIYIANILLIGGAVLISVWPASAATPAVFAVFVIFFPLALFVAGVMAYFLR